MSGIRRYTVESHMQDPVPVWQVIIRARGLPQKKTRKLPYNSLILLNWKIQKNLKTIEDLQLHHNFFIKGVLVWKLVHMKAYAY